MSNQMPPPKPQVPPGRIIRDGHDKPMNRPVHAFQAIPSEKSIAVGEFEDHGCTWKRIHAREIARFPDNGHLVIVLPMEDAAHDEGFGFMVVEEATMSIKATGTTPTRGEARRHGVYALGEVIGVTVLPSPSALAAGDADREMPGALRLAARLVLYGTLLLLVVGLALALAAGVQ